MTTVEDVKTETLPEDSFQKYLLLSLGLHISVFLFFTVRLFLFPSEPVLFQSALRVDLVALPDKIPAAGQVPRPSATPELPEKKVEPAPTKPSPEPTVNLNPVKPETKKIDEKKIKKGQSESINRLKQMSSIEKLEEQFRQDEADKARTFKGNAISKGSELTGLSRLEHDAYVSDVERHVHNFWSLESWLANKNLKAQVRVRFDSQGRVTFKQLVKSSGNPAFDDAVMATVDKASPVPAPPEKFVRLLENEGILFGFPE